MQQMTSIQLYFRLLRYVRPYWGIFALSILGMLMPASGDPKRDREIFLKILTMYDHGAWQRCKGEIPVGAASVN